MIKKMNKQTLFSIGFVFVSLLLVARVVLMDPGGPYDASADPKKDIREALANLGDRTHVLLVFGANWCPDCREFEKRSVNPPLKPFLDQHFAVVRVDVGEFDHNLDTVEKYGKPISKGIPAAVILDAKGEVVKTFSGGEFASMRRVREGAIEAQLLAAINGGKE